MKKDISKLLKQKNWEQVKHNGINTGPDVKPHHVLKNNWVLKLKYLTDVSPLIYKYRYYVHVYFQTAGVDSETNNTEVQCLTASLAPNMILSLKMAH